MGLIQMWLTWPQKYRVFHQLIQIWMRPIQIWHGQIWTKLVVVSNLIFAFFQDLDEDGDENDFEDANVICIANKISSEKMYWILVSKKDM